MALEWRSLADRDEYNCNWTGQNERGTMTNCGTICMGISGQGQPEGFNHTPEGFAPTLTAFAQYVTDNFGSSK